MFFRLMQSVKVTSVCGLIQRKKRISDSLPNGDNESEMRIAQTRHMLDYAICGIGGGNFCSSKGTTRTHRHKAGTYRLGYCEVQIVHLGVNVCFFVRGKYRNF